MEYCLLCPRHGAKFLVHFIYLSKWALGQVLVSSFSTGEIEAYEKLSELSKFTHWGSGSAGV